MWASLEFELPLELLREPKLRRDVQEAVGKSAERMSEQPSRCGEYGLRIEGGQVSVR